MKVFIPNLFTKKEVKSMDLIADGVIKENATTTMAITVGTVDQERERARQAYENTYHKVRADMSFDDWFLVWQKCLYHHSFD